MIFSHNGFPVRGNLDLQYAELDPAAYAAILNGSRAPGIACAFFIPRPPSYGLLGWILRQPGWKLFYRASENGSALPGKATASPVGLFFPWGLTTDDSASFAIITAETLKLSSSEGNCQTSLRKTSSKPWPLCW